MSSPLVSRLRAMADLNADNTSATEMSDPEWAEAVALIREAADQLEALQRERDTLDEANNNLVQRVARAERKLVQAHCLECNYREGGLGGPGCICEVVNKHAWEQALARKWTCQECGAQFPMIAGAEEVRRCTACVRAEVAERRLTILERENEVLGRTLADALGRNPHDQ